MRIRQKDKDILDPSLKTAARGMNQTVFSASYDMVDSIRPANGIKYKSKRAELGAGVYKNQKASKMSLRDYQEMAH